MRHLLPKVSLAFLTALIVTACGGGGSSGGGGGTTNNPPTANAGTNQTVTSGATATLNGSASSDIDGSISAYAWTQTGGTAVVLTGATSAQPTFVAPQVNAATTFTFSLIVTDNKFVNSTASTVTITVDPAVNVAPTANAGADQSTTAGFIVTLNGAASADTDGTIQTYTWTQTNGTPAITLTGASSVQPSFTAPAVGAQTVFTFSLVVTDNNGAASAADTVNITVDPPPPGTNVVTGTISFIRIPTTASAGLNYAAPQTQPARGITVRAVNTTTTAVVATGVTSSTGAYALDISNGLPIRIEAVAQMTRTGALPNWNFRVQDGTSSGTSPNFVAINAPYVYTDGVSFSSTATTPHDFTVPSGFNTAGAVTGTRASAPFAILDTAYQGVQTILGVAPTTNFPALVLDWATNNAGGDTFFSSTDDNNLAIQNIVLSADVASDTDEFDQHVIAHEFGHYIEFNFSRADNIGGAHGLGDKLDVRTAFGEGFGYAFAAIVLNDPSARDTLIGGSGLNCDVNHHCTSTFNIEANPPTSSAGVTNGNYGCWCSESSVWSILWDLYDTTPAEANDGVALGFAPMWTVLTSAEKTTPAVTSLFTFITVLRANASPANQALLDTLVSAQNVNSSNMDAFATTEQHFPSEVGSSASLPLYTNANIGGSVVVQSTNARGTHNKLGNHRFIRLPVRTTRTFNITVTTSNTNTDADPDFLIYRAGSFITSGESSVVGTETKNGVSLPGSLDDYILDVYDCANGCQADQGTPGNYVLTVTIN